MPTPEAEKLDLLLTLLEPEMERLGFKLLRASTTFKRGTGAITCRMAISRSSDVFTVIPAVYIKGLNGLAAQLENADFFREGWPACGMNIDSLRSGGSTRFRKLQEVTPRGKLIKELKALIHDDAIPFWNDFSTLDGLIAGYAARDFRVCDDLHWPWRAAAAYCLQKRFEEAIAVLEDAAEDWTRHDMKKRAERGIARVKKMAAKA